MYSTNNGSDSSLIGTQLSDLQGTLFDFLLFIQGQVAFSTVVFLRHTLAVHAFSVDGSPSWTALHLTTATHFQLKELYHRDFIAVVHVSPSTYQDVLAALKADLQRIAQTRIVFVCESMEQLVLALFRTCFDMKMINAVALVGGFYYSFSPFPEIKIRQHSMLDKREVFPNRLLNLHGYPLRIAMDGVEPRNFIYTNRRGEEVMGGSVGHLVTAFAEKLNATLLKFVDDKNRIPHHSEYDALLQADVIDIFIGLTLHFQPMQSPSDHVEIIKYCLILPVEPTVPQYYYYPMILQSPSILFMFGMVFVFSFVINCFRLVEHRVKLALYKMFLNGDCIRALLSQSFAISHGLSMKLRLVYFLTFVMGLFFNTWYQAILNTLVTSPPREPQLASLEDIQRSPLNVLMFREEYEDLRAGTDVLVKYRNVFDLTDDNNLYHSMRDSFNTSYSYPVPNNKWRIIQEQQSLYKTPLFRMSDICILRFVLMVFSLNENSIFTAELNRMISLCHQSGLYDQWVKNAFLELLEAGRIKRKSDYADAGPNPFTLYDMKWIWSLFAILAGVCCTIFALELVLAKLRRQFGKK